MIRIDRKQKVTDNNCDFKFLMKQNLIMILTRYIIFRLGTLYAKMTELQLDCALDLMRRLPPQQIEKNLSDLIDLVKLETLYYAFVSIDQCVRSLTYAKICSQVLINL